MMSGMENNPSFSTIHIAVEADHQQRHTLLDMCQHHERTDVVLLLQPVPFQFQDEAMDTVQEVAAHRVVLASAFFHALFTSGMKESTQNILQILLFSRTLKIHLLKTKCIIDETNFNLFCTRDFGWSRRGTRAVAVRPGSRRENLSVIACISALGLEHVQYRWSANDTGAIDIFVRDLLDGLMDEGVSFFDGVVVATTRQGELKVSGDTILSVLHGANRIGLQEVVEI
ncbi:Hypothetical protein PHPALM_6418 [Phytophthora palmivora]|uniref:Uncharacterized protein n=1 Tax=Phytophthora palmivora TaxID=4796 RepID=A0A2P4YEW7_9STRA|nr:Hypothetical protein PHPALM_6418 [Phytophthora palmivora]